MKLAFCLFKYYQFGGLERNFLRIAAECMALGHEVQVFTMGWKGARPPDLAVQLVPTRGLSNHARCRAYVAWLTRHLATTTFDLVVGFNRMPGLDLYYAADVCYVHEMARRRGPWVRLTPRYRTYAAFERAVFSPGATTEIMYLSDAEREHYIAAYGTPEARFHPLPPGIDRQRIRASLTGEIRREVRTSLGLAEGELLLLMVGSDFRRKGVDRSIRALAALPSPLRERSHLVVVGKGAPRPLQRLARRLGVAPQVHFLGGRDDVPRFLAGADLLLHPAVSENTGNAIVEALVAGLPVIATETCGYAFHVRASGAGEVVPSTPFRQPLLDESLSALLASPRLPEYRQRALAYADTTDLYSRPQTAAAIIERTVRRRSPAVDLPPLEEA